jgi:tRNA threonylcarbamoyladenosine biosynthesis protein TsaB
MVILALDTTTKRSSCAIARGGAVVCEREGDAGRPQAERLPGDLMALLAECGIALTAVDAFAVAVGPGSFTGLRIGIAAMQGLAFATGKPLAGVSGFDALAAIAAGGAMSGRPAAPGEARPAIATWVDAWRGEVYAALYEGGRPADAPVVAPPDELLRNLAGRPAAFVGDGTATYRRLIEDALGSDARFVEPAAPLLAGTIAGLAAARNEWPPPHAIRPLYVRRPDAELARAARAGADRAGRDRPVPGR